MDQVKIGKFIASCRKEKCLTQEELGNILNVNRKTISKWENGNYAPDISVLNSLSKTLGVSVSELLNCKKDDNENIIDALNYYNKRYKNKLLIIIFSVLLIICSALVSFKYYQSYYEYNVKSLESSNKDFELDGLLVYNKKEKYIIVNQIVYNDSYVGTDKEIMTKNVTVSLILNNKELIKKECIQEKQESLSEIMNNIYFKYHSLDTDDIEDARISLKYDEQEYIEIPIKFL